jgi:hypothetical protein
MKIRLDCRHAHRLASESMERHLPWRERLQLRLHLIACDQCASFVQEIGVLRRVAQKWGREE